MRQHQREVPEAWTETGPQALASDDWRRDSYIDKAREEVRRANIVHGSRAHLISPIEPNQTFVRVCVCVCNFRTMTLNYCCTKYEAVVSMQKTLCHYGGGGITIFWIVLPNNGHLDLQ